MQIELLRSLVPKRVAHHEGESVASLLARTAEANNIPTVEHLLLELGLDRPRVFRSLNHSKEEIEVLSSLLEIDPDTFARNCFVAAPGSEMRMVNHTSIRARLVERSHRKFSPASLAISPFIRTAWQVRTFPFCADSWEFLQETCSECGTKQGWYHAMGVERCDMCLHDLRRMEAEHVRESDRSALSEAAGLVSAESERVSRSLSAIPIEGLTATIALELVARLVPVIDNTMPLVRGVWRVDVDPKRLTSAVAEAWRLLRLWPDGPRELFSARISGAMESHSDGNRNRSMEFLRWSSGPNAPVGVRREVAKLKEICTFHSGQPMSFRGRSLIEPSETMRLLGREGSEVALIRRKGRLQPIFAIKLNHACPLYFKDDVADLKQFLDDRLRATQAAAALGLPKYAIPQLIHAGLLQTQEDALLRKFDADFIVRRSSLEALSHELHSAAETYIRNTRPLEVIVRVIGGGLKPWGTIVSMLLDGTIRYMRPNEGKAIKRLRVPRDVVEVLAGLRSIVPKPVEPPLGISIKEAGEILNLSAVSYTELFRSMRGGTDPKGVSSVPMALALDLADRFMSISELAGRLGLSTQKAQKVAEASGLVRTSLCGFKRTEVETLTGLHKGDMTKRPAGHPPCKSIVDPQPQFGGSQPDPQPGRCVSVKTGRLFNDAGQS
ncbi:TniQ family protein [Nitrobacter sp.]|uniref:TniQ family protein n=1 Tax=Nitrobacter sp. TaxID=29420 RepID=UPI00260F8D4C|nr:TniQ family protein [Nitrobacter sp.]